VNDHNGNHARLRYTATGALAALAAAGAIAGTVALAANPSARPRGHATVANGSPTKTPTSPVPVPGKTHTPQPVPQAFLTDAQQLVDNGTITATEGQVLEREIQAGRVDTQTLASSGFTPTQLQAVQQTLSDTKRALGRSAPPAAGKNSTPPQDAKTPTS
jgi:hypothetical protein